MKKNIIILSIFSMFIGKESMAPIHPDQFEALKKQRGMAGKQLTSRRRPLSSVHAAPNVAENNKDMEKGPHKNVSSEEPMQPKPIDTQLHDKQSDDLIQEHPGYNPILGGIAPPNPLTDPQPNNRTMQDLIQEHPGYNPILGGIAPSNPLTDPQPNNRTMQDLIQEQNAVRNPDAMEIE